MDILRIISISALVVAIATCAFAFLMYRRISERLDGLSMAHLTLSRTLQHMVSSTMPQHEVPSSNEVANTQSVDPNMTEQRNIVLNETLGVRRVAVSDDDNSNEESDQSEDEEDDGDTSSDSERSQESTPPLRSLNLTDAIDITEDNDNNMTLMTLQIVASENEEETDNVNEEGEPRIVEMDQASDDNNDESDLELDDEETSNNDEEAYYDDYPDNQTESSNLAVAQESNSDRSVQSTETEQPDDIVAFTNTSQSHPISDLKLQKVETLRKMALEQNLADEETIKKMKKPQLMSMLNS